jgi:hypothetical protein
MILAVLAAVPVANIVALGYMLEAEGRVVRSGRLRDGVPFAGALPRLGAIVLGSWLWLLVVRLVTQAAADAALVDPGGPAAMRWQRAQTAAVTVVGLHLVAALHGAPVVGNRGRRGDAFGQPHQQLVEGIVIVLHGLGRLARAFKSTLQQRQHQRAPVGKLAVQGGAADIGALDHQVQRRGHAVLGKHGIGRVQQLGAADIGTGSFGSHADNYRTKLSVKCPQPAYPMARPWTKKPAVSSSGKASTGRSAAATGGGCQSAATGRPEDR